MEKSVDKDRERDNLKYSNVRRIGRAAMEAISHIPTHFKHLDNLPKLANGRPVVVGGTLNTLDDQYNPYKNNLKIETSPPKEELDLVE